MRIEVRRHGQKAWTYQALDHLQRQIANQVKLGEKGALLLSEVAPVITLSRRTVPQENLILSQEFLRSRGVDLYPVDRGGLGTYHGPGQWILFAVERLEFLTGDRIGVKKAVQSLLQIGLRVAQKYEPEAEVRDGAELGVWTPKGKVAAVGVHIENGVLLHGLSLNGYRTDTSFLGLKPCGLDAPVDFLIDSYREDEKSKTKLFEKLGEEILQEARVQFLH